MKALRPADTNATSFESTAWCLPSYTLTRMSCSVEAGDRAFGQHLAHAFLDGRDELARDRAAHDVVDELEARAALERLDAQVHLAELAGATRLLLVAAVAFGRPRDRLAVGHARAGWS